MFFSLNACLNILLKKKKKRKYFFGGDVSGNEFPDCDINSHVGVKAVWLITFHSIEDNFDTNEANYIDIKHLVFLVKWATS